MSLFNKIKKDFFLSKENNLTAVVNGNVISLSEVRDEVFSTGMMGPGIAIRPNDSEYVAPADGEIIVIPESKHAIGMRLNGGIEVLIHIGLDTVMLKGEGFEPQVKVGQKVKRGDLIMKINLEFFAEKGIDVVTPIIILNSEEYNLNISEEFKTCVAGETTLIKY